MHIEKLNHNDKTQAIRHQKFVHVLESEICYSYAGSDGLDVETIVDARIAPLKKHSRQN